MRIALAACAVLSLAAPVSARAPGRKDAKALLSYYADAKGRSRRRAPPSVDLGRMAPGEVDAFMREVQAKKPPLWKRIEVFSHIYLGVPYQRGPLGEGPAGAFDTDPLISLQKVDCVTFIEQVLAMSFSRDLDSAEQVLRRIRYRDGVVRYKSRNHFAEADWLPNNIAAGFLEDITAKVAGADVRVASRTVDKAAWYEAKTTASLEGVELQSLAEGEKARLAEALREAGMDVPAQPVSLPYLPMSALPKHLDALPSGAVLSLVREDQPDAPVLVSHQGLLVRHGGETFFRHAVQDEAVKDSPLLEYFYKYFNSSWRLCGLNVAYPREPRP